MGGKWNEVVVVVVVGLETWSFERGRRTKKAEEKRREGGGGMRVGEESFMDSQGRARWGWEEERMW